LDLNKPFYLELPENVAETFTDDTEKFDVGKYIEWMLDAGNLPKPTKKILDT